MELYLKNISKTYGDKKAVHDLSLKVPSGVIYGIIGPNGAGKTTTIRMIMDITKPDSGEIIVGGNPATAEFKNLVGYLPEERGLYKKMTLKEVIVYMGELKGRSSAEIESRMDSWLERMQLADYKLKKVEELSKGMQQKLQFITTIIHDPEIVILDEIFSGLDPLNMELIKGVLLDLKRQGKTILFSTHVMEQAEKLCDYVCMISKGEKVIDGSMSEVKSKFGSNSLQIDIEGDGNFMASLPGVQKMTEFNNYIELRIDEGLDTNALLKTVTDRVKVRGFSVVEPSLYDIFIELANVDPDQMNQNMEARRV